MKISRDLSEIINSTILINMNFKEIINFNLQNYDL
jgi:hypothetical protein